MSLSILEETVARELVRYAAGRLINCPCCGEILDARSTVVLTDNDDRTVTRCAPCYGKPVGNIKAGSVTVYDGRALWKSKSRNVWKFREATVA